jgi:hypothetical protein
MAISMIVDFGRKATANYRIQNEELRLEQEIAAERAKHEALLARREYVQTETVAGRVSLAGVVGPFLRPSANGFLKQREPSTLTKAENRIIID